MQLHWKTLTSSCQLGWHPARAISDRIFLLKHPPPAAASHEPFWWRWTLCTLLHHPLLVLPRPLACIHPICGAAAMVGCAERLPSLLARSAEAISRETNHPPKSAQMCSVSTSALVICTIWRTSAVCHQQYSSGLTLWRPTLRLSLTPVKVEVEPQQRFQRGCRLVVTQNPEASHAGTPFALRPSLRRSVAPMLQAYQRCLPHFATDAPAPE
mmetsp:Transcript_63555/g.151589  ORF Transcript_63555/g.151589 Transcript_63555/m.151589 type:complete len:212 (-) Transcript_63555:635-1270(-)